MTSPVDSRHCNVCPEEFVLDPEHGGSLLHRFNTLLWEYHNYRKALVKNRNGIQLDVSPSTLIPPESYIYTTETKQGNHVFKVTPDVLASYGGIISFTCTLQNISKNNIIISHAQVLHPSELFKFSDPNGYLENNRYPELEPGISYSFTLTFTPKGVTQGTMKIPISFILTPRKEPKPNMKDKENSADNHQFTLVRSITVDIRKEDYIPLMEKSPFTRLDWKNVYMKPNTLGNFKYKYPIPKNRFRCMMQGLKEMRGMSDKDLATLHELENKMKQPLTANNYNERFHTLLWLEEAGTSLALMQYNMENVIMNVVEKGLELLVPGLAEKRPSVIQQDRIHIRIHNDHKGYEGIIKYVQDSKIIISHVDEELIHMLRVYPAMEMDVSFVLGRVPLERMHEGITSVAESLKVRDLFPSPESQNKQKGPTILVGISSSDIINKRILNNEEQLCAMKNIVNGCSKNAPYVVYGPPGTGKTETIVEAILQIKRLTSKRILVCAPANAACDMLARKLMVYCTNDELLRIHSLSRDEIAEDLKPYSNEVGVNPPAGEVAHYRIIVSTLVYIGRYSGTSYKPDIVFIDEAAQAIEPEVCIPIGLSSKAQVVLAGDPKQLGPNCSSKVAEKKGLGTTLLERLMELDLYKSHNPNYLTMLIRNYRSHPEILKLPNQLFYEDKLKACCAEASNDPIARINIFPLVYRKRPIKYDGYPNEFCAVIAKEQREGQSPSYFNYHEAQMVMRYIDTILKLNLGDQKVLPSQIGVVTPYKRQVYKIKGILNKKDCEEVEVGTTETFQGREKRIIIVSSVRAREDLMLYDRKYRLGFVRQPNRFNVAITRAKSKLIIIGCPLVLQTDEKWCQFIEICEAHKSYYGAPITKRTDNLRNDIYSRVTKVHQVSGPGKKRL